MTRGVLAWKSYAADKTPPHPTGRVPMVEDAWCAAVLKDGDTEVGHVWFTTSLDAVFADFTFADSVNGSVDAAVLPLVVDSFFGRDGHTRGRYHDAEAYTSAHLTNLRTGTEWHGYWEEIDEIATAMKSSNDFVPRQVASRVRPDPVTPLVWESYTTDMTPPHPTKRAPPSPEAWVAAVLMERDREVGHVWVVRSIANDHVFADFTFDDAIGGGDDVAVLPFVVDGFFGHDGHTFGFYRDDSYRHVHLTNLRTGTAWEGSWWEIDAIVRAMKEAPDFVARPVR